jgi:hypothetical protein
MALPIDLSASEGGASGCFSSQAHQAAATPTVSARATSVGATVMTHRRVADTTPMRNSAPRSDNADVAFATKAAIRTPAVLMWSTFSA